ADSRKRLAISKFMSLIANPWFGGIAGIASIISLPLAIYLYVSGQAHPAFTMYVHPVRAAIVKSGETSSLKVLYNNKETGPNITAIQVAIWNDGKRAIHGDDILEDITLRLEPHYTILESPIRKLTRRATGFDIIRSIDQLTFKWRILEPGDGAVIQIIYDGPASVPEVLLNGTIEGQSKLITIAPKDSEKEDKSNSSPRSEGLKLGLLLIGSFVLTLVISKLFPIVFTRWPFVGYFIVVPAGIAAIGIVAFIVCHIFNAVITPYPPFGF
ncbi:MAG: hypothetical protein ABSC60_12500, partial [Acidobacteriota bacterium]